MLFTKDENRTLCDERKVVMIVKVWRSAFVSQLNVFLVMGYFSRFLTAFTGFRLPPDFVSFETLLQGFIIDLLFFTSSRTKFFADFF